MKHKNLLFSTLLLSLLSQAQELPNKYNTSVFFEEGSQNLQQSKYLESANAYNQVHSLDYDYSNAQYERLLSLIYAGKQEEALAICEAHYKNKLFIDYPPLLIIHSILLSDKNELQPAIEKLNEAEKYIKNSANLNYNKAIIYIRTDEKQKAVDLLKTNLEINPTHTSSLFSLGILALEDGQLIQGNLLLMTYLLFEPNSEKATSALMALNKDYSKTYTSKPVLKISDGKEDFSLLEELLRNKYPYNNKFKLLISFDDLAPRNIQAITEYFKDHEIKENSFESRFENLFKYIIENNLTEEFLYSSLINFKDSFENEYSKNEKDILKFQNNHIKEKLWQELYNEATLQGEKYKVVQNENGSTSYFQKKNNLADGKYLTVSNLGVPVSQGYFSEDLLTGKKTLFRKNGNIEGEENFLRGKKNGVSKYYYSNNKLSFQAEYKDDELNGKYVLNYPSEQLNCTGSYKMNEYDGESQCYYSDGTLKTIANYKNGKFHGTYKKFNELGEISEEGNYVDNELEGTYTIYHSKGKIKSVNTVKDKLPNSFISYYINGQIEKVNTYKDGKLESIRENNIEGNIRTLQTFNSKEELTNLKYYNADGALYFEENYVNGKAKQAFQYFSDGTSEKLKNTGMLSFKNLDGQLISQGNLQNGIMQNQWNYYYLNGNLKSQNFYKDGNETGNRKTYLESGALDYITEIENNQLNGLYKDYVNDKIRFITYYNTDKINGPLTTYYTTGKIESEKFFYDGSLEGKTNNYNQEGKLTQTTNFINDKIIDVTYLSNGESVTLDYTNQKGIVSIKQNKFLKRNVTIKNGEKNGVYEVVNSENEFVSKENFVNNKLHGKAFFYNNLGKVKSEFNYFLDALNGEQKRFDLNGKLTQKSLYENGLLVGTEYVFFPNGKILSSSSFNSGYKHGEEILFNSEETKLAVFHYFENDLVAYQFLTKDGQLSDKIKFNNDVKQIKSHYKDGQLALEINFEKSLKNGKYIIYNPQNKIDFETNFQKGVVNGLTTFYVNEKKYKSYEMVNGIQQGQYLYFDEQENIKYSTDFNEDEMHGYFKAFENKKITKTRKYDSDLLVEIL